MLGAAPLFGKKSAKPSLSESRRWGRAGVEPSTTALLADPIAILLMRADRLSAEEVEAILREARQRLPNRLAPGAPTTKRHQELHTTV
jgi:hypothetical protein